MTFNAGTAGICDATTIVQLAVIGAVVNTLPINEPPQPVTLCSVAPPVKVIAKESAVPSGTLEGIGGVAVNDSRYARLVSALGEIGCAATVGDVPGVVAAAEGAELSEVRQLIEELPLDDPLVGPLSVAHALCVVVAAHDGVEVAGSMPRIASIANRLTGLFNDLDAQVAV